MPDQAPAEATSSRFRKRSVRKVLILAGLYVFFLAALVEITLRLQQALGPLYDLEMADVSLENLSDIVNHRPIPGLHVDRFGRRTFDEFGVRHVPAEPDFGERPEAFRIFFQGDSFMDGYALGDDIPRQVWRVIQASPLRGTPIQLHNGGNSSYSPSIHIAQARQVVPRLKPQFVILAVDETDLGDDYVRYRRLVARDDEGRIVAVKRTPINDAFQRGLLDVKDSPSYLLRLVGKLYHTRVRMPRLEAEYRNETDPRHVLSFSGDADAGARDKYHAEIDLFTRNMDEWCSAMVQMLGGPRRILVVRHPHLEHLKPDDRGFRWNTFVRDALRSVTGRHGIAFYDAEPDLAAAFGPAPEKFYKPNDMHFTDEGLQIYGELIGKRALPMIEALIRDNPTAAQAETK